MKKRVWTGWVLSGLGVAFLIFDIVIKFTGSTPVVEAMERLGYPVRMAPVIALLEIPCLVLYLIPGTSVLGALLWTAFLGGATASQVRIAEPLFSHILFPTYVALFLWGGLWLRNDRLRALLPVRRQA